MHSRNVNLYGQYGARLDRTATVEGRRHPPRLAQFLNKSGFLGGGPEIHLNRLENLWVDRIIYTHHWRALLKDLSDEWTAAAIAVSYDFPFRSARLIQNIMNLGRSDVGVSGVNLIGLD